MSRITAQAGFAMGVFAVAGLAAFVAFGSASAQPAQLAVNAACERYRFGRQRPQTTRKC